MNAVFTHRILQRTCLFGQTIKNSPTQVFMLTVFHEKTTNKSCLSAIAIKRSVITCCWFFGFLFIVQKAARTKFLSGKTPNTSTANNKRIHCDSLGKLFFS